MSRQLRKQKLVGPWRSLHAAVWLIGIAILAWKNWWWPGILVLVAISLVIEALLRRFAPQAYEDEGPALPPSPEPSQSAAPSPPAEPAAPSSPSAAPSSPPPAPPVPEHRLELLPSTCLKCGGPIRGHDVRWTGVQSADCPYCGANLPMEKG